MVQPSILFAFTGMILAFGCARHGSSANQADAPTAKEFESAEEPPPDVPPSNTESSRPGLSVEECEAKSGDIVGDIGDGAIHREGYLCPSGEPPLGTITAPPDGPIGVEGSVCCP